MKTLPLVMFLFLTTNLFSNDAIWEKTFEHERVSYFKAIDNCDSLNIIAVANYSGQFRKVLKSTDGGFTWNFVFEDSYENNYLYPELWYPANDIAYPAENFCIVACDSSTFLRTYNGGKTWDTTETNYGINDFQGFRIIDMFDENHGLMASLFHMIVSHDGFQTWDTIPPFGTPAEYAIFAAEMIDTNKIAMVTRDVDGSPQFNERFYRSDDGGKSWVEYEHPDYRIPMNLHFVDTLVGYEIGQIKTGIGNTKRDLIHKTTDGGRSWFNVLDSMIEDGLNFGLLDLDFYDRENGIVVGNNGKTYWTQDGGKNWKYDPTLRNIIGYYGPPVEYVCLVGPQTAVVCTFEGDIYRGESGTSFVQTYAPVKCTSKIIVTGNTAKIHFVSPSQGQAKIEITDLLGNIKYLQNRFLPNQENEILLNITDYAQGLYLYRIFIKNEVVASGKFIVE
ncbi:MAG: YCF48-related protein [Candidatus Kapabacteria bacterium]|jgi:photosystem II stability/assembly factor-like uncharacterized protein|nr:YCF48-related protein [Candidatus Kapabacteria bacterium]